MCVRVGREGCICVWEKGCTCMGEAGWVHVWGWRVCVL